jgi:hypothetical protein
MLRTVVPVLALTFLVTACTTVPATLPVAELGSPAPAVAAAKLPTAPIEAASTQLEQLRQLDTSAVFDGEVELLVPLNLVAIHPFGASHVSLEFEQSVAKIERQRKLPGA